MIYRDLSGSFDPSAFRISRSFGDTIGREAEELRHFAHSLGPFLLDQDPLVLTSSAMRANSTRRCLKSCNRARTPVQTRQPRRISKAPTNCPTSIISATVTALRRYSVPRVKIIHCCQLGPRPLGGTAISTKCGKSCSTSLAVRRVSMAIHVISLIKKRDLAIDVNQISARATTRPS